MSAARHVDLVTGRRIRQPWRENREYAAAASRFLRALGRRAGADIDALPLLADVQRQVDTLMSTAVAECRADGYSWSDIGRRLGITKQAAQQRYGTRAVSIGAPQLAAAGR